MPPRIARSHAAASAPKASKASKINKGKKRQLDAFAIASHEAPEKLQIRQHRLGESFGEHPRAKRRRLQDDDEDSEGEEKIDSARLKQSRNVEKRTHGRKGGLDDEDVEFGSDSEGNEWTMGGMGSEESDEEIDSDEAFGRVTRRGSMGGLSEEVRVRRASRRRRWLSLRSRWTMMGILI